MALANFSTWSDDSENSDESFSLNSIGYKKILDELSASIPTVSNYSNNQHRVQNEAWASPLTTVNSRMRSFQSHIRLGTNVTAINYENR